VLRANRPRARQAEGLFLEHFSGLVLTGERMLAMREEGHLCTGFAVLLRKAQISTDRCSATKRQSTLQYPSPFENVESDGIHGLRFSDTRRATTMWRQTLLPHGARGLYGDRETCVVA
jgi:hypothetical protein